MRKLIGKTASKIGRRFTLLSQLLYKEQNYNQIYLDAWFQDKGDKNLKMDYGDLNEKSIVFDLGGYEGQWSSDIFAKYCCFIYIFEPVHKFSQEIENRFSKNPKIFVFNFGLGNEDNEVLISIDEYNSSIIMDISSETEKIKLRKTSAFIEESSIKRIDLMKINIEGAEYDLLEHLIDSGYIKIIKNIQVQFHTFVPNAESRMEEIQRRLCETHHLKWQYKFVWESWESKN